MTKLKARRRGGDRPTPQDRSFRIDKFTQPADAIVFEGETNSPLTALNKTDASKERGPRNRRDSSKTRVQPVFRCLLDRDPSGATWLSRLWELARGRRPRAIAPPHEFGPLIAEETSDKRSNGLDRCFEYVAPPPKSFLRWLIENVTAEGFKDQRNFGASGANADKRRALFSTDPEKRQTAVAEALRELQERGARGSGQQWWAFEGFSHVDCCLITPRVVLLIEGKRTERVSPSTLWYPRRNQLWRNVEAAQQLATDRAFGVILAVETDEDGRAALTRIIHETAEVI